MSLGKRALTGIGVVLMLVSGCSAKRGSNREQGASVSSPASPAAPTQLVDSYDVTLSSRVTVNGQQLTADVRGVLAVSPLWTNDGTWRSLRLVAKEVALTAGKQRQSTLAGLDKPFAVRVDAAGTLQEVAFDADLPAESRRVQQALAGYVQFSCAPDGTSAKWSLKETDASGKYQTEYERTDPEWVAKRKLAYSGGEAVQLDVRRSQSAFRARCGEFPREVVVAEELVGKELGLEAETTLSVRQRSQGEQLVASAIGGLLPNQRRFAPSAVVELPTREPMAAEPISVEDALARLEPVAESIFDHKTVRRLSARLLAKPEELKLLQRDYEQNELHRHAVSRLLVAIGSAQSWALVAQLLDDSKLPASARIELLTALLFASRTDLRTLESVHALGRSEIETLASAAVNTEGSLLKRAQDTGEKAVGPLVERYVAGYQPTLPTRVQSAYLHGFAYVGTAQMLDALRQATQSSSETLRLAAVSALEGVEGAQADEWILERLARDTRATVRERAIRACGYRASLPCGKAVARALVSDPDRLVRLRALEVFSQAGNPAVTGTLLERVSRKDADASLRRAATDALTRLRAQAAAQSGANDATASAGNSFTK
jgi:HEAT repeat protein